tara:strand:- start:2866 stop:3255 length:390 start_codon:yes stop_codon:yes gene_type:complete
VKPKHALARDAGKMKDKRFNKIFSKAFQEAPDEIKDKVMSAMQQPSIVRGEMNMEKMNAMTDLVQGYLNRRAKKRTGIAAKTVVPGLVGSAISATARQPRYVPGPAGSTEPTRLTNMERFARMLGLGPY